VREQSYVVIKAVIVIVTKIGVDSTVIKVKGFSLKKDSSSSKYFIANHSAAKAEQ